MSDKNKQCSNCWSSMFRRKRGKTLLFCDYWYKPVELDGICEMHNKSVRCGGRSERLPEDEQKITK